MMKRILLTGGTGFIGSHLAKALVESLGKNDFLCVAGRSVRGTTWHWHQPGPQWCRTGLDVCDEKDVAQCMEEVRPNFIFHLAGNPNVKLAEDDTHGSKLWQTNVDGTRLLLEHAPEDCRFTFASSATVYGDAWRRCDESCPTNPISLYGASKLAGETLVGTYTRMGRISGVNLRYVANVGSGCTHGLVYDIVRKLRSDVPTLDLLGNYPGSKKPYMHVADTVAATMHIASLGCNGVFNVSPSDSLTVFEVATAVMLKLGIEKPIRWLGGSANWPGDNPLVSVSNFLLVDSGFIPNCLFSYEAVAKAAREIPKCQTVA